VNSNWIYSRLATDPELGNMVDVFVQRMPDRIRTIESQATRRNWERLARTAQQLKGAAGSHGFDDITPYAARLERTAEEASQEERIFAAVDELVELCRRVRPGKPQTFWEF